MVFCKLCKIPLAHKEQFVGHHVISHEFNIKDAEHAWHMTVEGPLCYPRRGGFLGK